MAIGGVYFLKARRIVLFVAALCLCVSVVNRSFVVRATAQTAEPRLEGPLAEGVKLISQGQFQQAVEVLNRFKQTAPQDARSYFYCGMALAQAGRLEDAASELVEAVHLAPDKLEYRVF